METQPDFESRVNMIVEALLELNLYKNNREIFRKNEALDDTPGSKAYDLLKKVAENGGTYEDVGSSREEIKNFFGAYLVGLFDSNSK